MCFSLSASLTASALLSLIAFISFKKVKTISQIPFAAIPALFALQQFAEALVWWSASSGDSQLQLRAGTFFVFFAFLVWPFWLPFSLWALEKEELRRRALLGFSLFGFLFSAISAWVLMGAKIMTSITVNHVCYTLSSFDLVVQFPFYFFVYLLMALIPFFISSHKQVKYFGIAGFVSCFITYVSWASCFISVWCFFAALLSTLLVIWFPNDQA